MKKEPAVFLQHILGSIEKIEEHTAGQSEDDFLESVKTQDAVI